MYNDKNEFNRDVKPEMLETTLYLKSTTAGVFTYEVTTNDGIRVKVESTMNDVADMNYFCEETLESLTESDYIKVYFNEVLTLSYDS